MQNPMQVHAEQDSSGELCHTSALSICRANPTRLEPLKCIPIPHGIKVNWAGPRTQSSSQVQALCTFLHTGEFNPMEIPYSGWQTSLFLVLGFREAWEGGCFFVLFCECSHMKSFCWVLLVVFQRLSPSLAACSHLGGAGVWHFVILSGR